MIEEGIVAVITGVDNSFFILRYKIVFIWGMPLYFFL